MEEKYKALLELANLVHDSGLSKEEYDRALELFVSSSTHAGLDSMLTSEAAPDFGKLLSDIKTVKNR